MEKLKRYIRKNIIPGLTYEAVFCGNDYFYNVKAPTYEAVFLRIDRTGTPEENTKLQKIVKKIKSYCTRYGYEITHEINYIPGETRYFIARCDDLERYSNYQYYVTESVKECELLRHIYGPYKGIGQDMKVIMEDRKSVV